MDVATAFLNDVLEEEIFMAQPEGFHDGSGRFVKLKKALYGLKQALRQWYLKLRGVLEEIGFTPSTADHSLFMLGEGEQRSFMVVYVDAILIFSPSSDLVKEVMLKLQDKFKCKALGDCVKGPEEESVGEEERRRFHSLVGSLMYAAVNTRPDVAFATGQLARHEELVGREEIAAPVAAADAAEAGVAVTGLVAAVDAAELGAALPVETEVVAAGGEMETARVATTAGEASAAETAAASNGGLNYPSAARPTATPLPVVRGLAAEEVQMVPGSVESPAPVFAESSSPVEEAEIVVVVAEGVRRQDGSPDDGIVQTAAMSAGTSAAAVDTNTRGRNQLVDGRPGCGSSETVSATRGKAGKKIRARPAPRRPGAGLGPGTPGPLLGWLLQWQPPRAPGHHWSSRGEVPTSLPTE
ncbi:unnamed protein product [Closterium sp. NIES-53]